MTLKIVYVECVRVFSIKEMEILYRQRKREWIGKNKMKTVTLLYDLKINYNNNNRMHKYFKYDRETKKKHRSDV